MDDALVGFSEDLSKVYGISPLLKTEEQLLDVVDVFRSHVVPKLRLWEFFVLDVDALSKSLKFFLIENRIDKEIYDGAGLRHCSLNEKAAILRKDGVCYVEGWGRYGRKIRLKVVASLIYNACKLEHGEPSIETMVREFESVANEVNLPFYRQYDDDINAIVDNVRSRARFLRLAENGPKLGAISRSCVVTQLKSDAMR